MNSNATGNGYKTEFGFMIILTMHRFFDMIISQLVSFNNVCIMSGLPVVEHLLKRNTSSASLGTY